MQDGNPDQNNAGWWAVGGWYGLEGWPLLFVFPVLVAAVYLFAYAGVFIAGMVVVYWIVRFALKCIWRGLHEWSEID